MHTICLVYVRHKCLVLSKRNELSHLRPAVLMLFTLKAVCLRRPPSRLASLVRLRAFLFLSKDFSLKTSLYALWSSPLPHLLLYPLLLFHAIYLTPLLSSISHTYFPYPRSPFLPRYSADFFPLFLYEAAKSGWSPVLLLRHSSSPRSAQLL